uniref:Tetraspanin-31 n=1 Tax=Knipowitschia caucasica TaxID=637954 RepID=A0AAV2M0T2_KNICA
MWCPTLLFFGGIYTHSASQRHASRGDLLPVTCRTHLSLDQPQTATFGQKNTENTVITTDTGPARTLQHLKMVCGGFTCSKNALCSLNVVYMLVGLLLIGVAAWGKGFGLVSSIHIIGGVIAVGFFLLLISIVGLIGALHHHQVMLFFYMVILFIVFLFQFGVSCSCLAMNRGQQEALLSSAWGILQNKTRIDLETQLNCCGLFKNSSQSSFDTDWANCPALCKKNNDCATCGGKMLNHATEALKILGGVGLFFSFTEILGVWLAVRYRNQKDPRANPSAFL